MSPQQNGTRVAGRQLLPVIVDERDPKWLYARVPKSPTHIQDGFIDITCGGFARAVNRAAGWIEELCGQSSTFDTLAYIGPSDIRYCIFVVGACKVGYKVKALPILPVSYIMRYLIHCGMTCRLSSHPLAIALQASWLCLRLQIARRYLLPEDIIFHKTYLNRVVFPVMRYKKSLNSWLRVKVESTNLRRALTRPKMSRWWFCTLPALLVYPNQLFLLMGGLPRLININSSILGRATSRCTRPSMRNPSFVQYPLSMFVIL